MFPPVSEKQHGHGKQQSSSACGVLKLFHLTNSKLLLVLYDRPWSIIPMYIYQNYQCDPSKATPLDNQKTKANLACASLPGLQQMIMSPQLYTVAVKLQKTFTSRCQRKCFGIPATKPLVHAADDPAFLSSAQRYEDVMTELTLHIWLILRFKTTYQHTHVLSP